MEFQKLFDVTMVDPSLQIVSSGCATSKLEYLLKEISISNLDFFLTIGLETRLQEYGVEIKHGTAGVPSNHFIKIIEFSNDFIVY